MGREASEQLPSIPRERHDDEVGPTEGRFGPIGEFVHRTGGERLHRVPPFPGEPDHPRDPGPDRTPGE